MVDGFNFFPDPNVDEIVSFGPKKMLSYSNKQLIAKEIETVKMHRVESSLHQKASAAAQASPLPNHLQTLKARSVRRAETPVSGQFPSALMC